MHLDTFFVMHAEFRTLLAHLFCIRMRLLSLHDTQ